MTCMSSEMRPERSRCSRVPELSVKCRRRCGSCRLLYSRALLSATTRALPVFGGSASLAREPARMVRSSCGGATDGRSLRGRPLRGESGRGVKHCSKAVVVVGGGVGVGREAAGNPVGTAGAIRLCLNKVSGGGLHVHMQAQAQQQALVRRAPPTHRDKRASVPATPRTAPSSPLPTCTYTAEVTCRSKGPSLLVSRMVVRLCTRRQPPALHGDAGEGVAGVVITIGRKCGFPASPTKPHQPRRRGRACTLLAQLGHAHGRRRAIAPTPHGLHWMWFCCRWHSRQWLPGSHCFCRGGITPPP